MKFQHELEIGVALTTQQSDAYAVLMADFGNFDKHL